MIVGANPASKCERLSTPHPAFGHLARFAKKGEPAGCGAPKGA
jgi:hypothetical protein